MKHFRVLSNLPQLPEDLEKLSQQTLDDSLVNDPVITHVSAERLARESSQLKLQIDGRTVMATRSQRIDLPVAVVDWIKANIADDFVNIGVSITKATSSYHGAHTDFTRAFTLLYLLEDSGPEAETVFYQEAGHPVIRPKMLGLRITDYSTLTEIESVVIPTRTWVILNADVIHGVRNITKDRRAIHIGFDHDLPFEELPVIQRNNQLDNH